MAYQNDPRLQLYTILLGFFYMLNFKILIFKIFNTFCFCILFIPLQYRQNRKCIIEINHVSKYNNLNKLTYFNIIPLIGNKTHSRII
jgi:1,4-dihydroxy-2-naphthoate octaprenyltransferase